MCFGFYQWNKYILIVCNIIMEISQIWILLAFKTPGHELITFCGTGSAVIFKTFSSLMHGTFLKYCLKNYLQSLILIHSSVVLIWVFLHILLHLQNELYLLTTSKTRKSHCMSVNTVAFLFPLSLFLIVFSSMIVVIKSFKCAVL